MANWDHVYDLTGIVSPRGKVATDGTFIYYLDVGTGVYRYNYNTNLDELLFTNATMQTEAQSHIPGQSIVLAAPSQLAVFNQQLYVGVMYTYEFDEVVFHNRHVVFKVSGSTPVQVDFIDPETTDVSTGAYSLYADDTLIVHYLDPYCKKSSSGTSWSNIAQPIQDTGEGVPTAQSYARDFRSTDIYTGLQGDVYKFTGSQWVKQGNLNGSAASTLMDGKDTVWITRHDANEYTDDNFATYKLPLTDNSLFAAMHLNMPYVVAHKPNDFDSSFSNLYRFNGTDFVLLDTTDPGPPFWSTPIGGNQENKAWFIRLDNGAVYALTRSGTTWDVWHRDADLAPTPDSWACPACAPPCDFAEFYYGIETPTLRSTMPFCGVEPGAITINEFGVAVVGNIRQDDESVAYAEPFYTTWTDMSTGVTANPVTSLKNV